MPATTYRLLIVDDEPLVLELVKLHLRSYDYDTSTASDGVEALRRIREEPWDLVLLDISMPGTTGLEVLEAIRHQHSLLSLPVIMMTAQDSSHQIVQALEMGANDYLIKPLDIDITLARIRTQLTCKDLAATKDEFLSFASHDLKKPLMLMEDIARTLREQLAPGSTANDQTRQDIDNLMLTAHHMSKVVDGFLNQEALKSGALVLEKRPVRLSNLVADVVRENTVYAESKGISLQSSCPADLPGVEADQQKLKGVIDNLVGNAIKFSPADTGVQVCAGSDGEYVRVEIVDAGPGLSDSDLSKLFTKYASLSNKPTGHETSSGIGLSICRLLVEQHGGRIGAQNNPGGGATFWVSLPIALKSSAPEQQKNTLRKSSAL